MATTTITQFKRLARTADGDLLPVPETFVASETLTAAGTSAAMAAGTKFVRVATDTAYTIDAYGSSLLILANSVEYFPAEELQTFTLVAV